MSYRSLNERVLDEFGFGDGLVNASDDDVKRMANEIVLLRDVVRILAEHHRPVWMRHSPCDEAYERALPDPAHSGSPQDGGS